MEPSTAPDEIYFYDKDEPNLFIMTCAHRDCERVIPRHPLGACWPKGDPHGLCEEHRPLLESQGFTTKDSGAREQFASGMQRDTEKAKPRYDLVDPVLLKRWAELMGRGADKYGADNWRKAAGEEELKRFKSSAFRHMMQLFEGDRTEDHAAAVCFNVAGYEYVLAKLNKPA